VDEPRAPGGGEYVCGVIVRKILPHVAQPGTHTVIWRRCHGTWENYPISS